ncbi:MAG: gliding motility-associated C-terminal domain-containing protein [Bacteroidia bacterium]|nr:gliding motility-associated C-terminal domain-containing protein [Bacteroidia bacterium]
MLTMLWTNIHAQTVYCPPNINFENNNFSGWTLYTGGCCPINTPTLSGPVAGRHTITSGTGLDPYGLFPVVDPAKGLYSLKLGNNSVRAQAERARYYVHVPSNLNNYSLLLKYAVVLENPSHTPADQPRFEIKAYDSITGVPISCAQFSFVASSVLPGFSLSTLGSNVYYKPWSLASLNLSGFAGRTVAVDFASGDCDRGRHFGYGYVDVNCVLFEVSSVACKGTLTSTLTAPPGYQHYRWYDSTLTTLLDTNQVASVPTPATFNKYTVVLTAYPGFGCDDTLSTTLYVSDTKVVVANDTLICKNKAIQLVDTATSNARFEPLSFSWSPSVNLSCSTCLNPIASPGVQTKYVLSVTDNNGCVVKDSLTISIRSDSIVLQPQNVLVCKGQPALFRVSMSGVGPYTYQWRKNGIPIASTNNDTLSLTTVAYSDTGNYSVLINWGCDSLLSNSVYLRTLPGIQLLEQPESLEKCLGKSATFFVEAHSSAPIVYQWKRNGVIIPGANLDSLFLTSISPIDLGYYQVILTSICDTIYSDTARLRLLSPPSIEEQPLSKVQCIGDTFSIKVKVEGGPVQYQWMKNGVPIPGKILDSLLFSPVLHIDSGSYSVRVIGECDTLLSSVAVISLNSPPSISLQPNSFTGCLGSNQTFKVNSIGASSYQWYKNGNSILGATLDSLIINGIQASDTGNYFVTVKGNCDSINSIEVKLGIYMAPQILVQTDSLNVCEGGSGLMKVLIGDITGVSLQWLKGNSILSNEQNDTLNFTNIGSSDTGYYRLRIISICDTLYSDSVKLSLLPKTQIVLEPQSEIRCLEDTFSLKTLAIGFGAINYQWYKNNTAIIGQQLDSLVFTSAAFADTGSYFVIAQGNCGIDTSLEAHVFLNTPPQILVQPDSIFVCKNETGSLRVLALGASSFQWYHNGVILPGEIKDTLFINSVMDADTGNYFVSIKGNCDSLLTKEVYIAYKPKPVISFEPISMQKCEGSSGNFVTGVVSDFPIIYQWIKDGVELPGRNIDSLNLDTIQLSDTGYYQVRVISGCDTLYSDSATLSVIRNTQIVLEPITNNRCFGDQFSFTVEATGSDSLSYQWYKNGMPLFGEVADSLLIFSTQFSDTGNYYVSVYGACGHVSSDTVKLNMNTPLQFTQQPNSSIVCLYSDWTVYANGTGFNTYQWYKNNGILAGKTADSLVLANLNYADTGSYFVIGIGACDSLFSDTIQITTPQLLSVTKHPIDIISCAGNTVKFISEIVGAGPISYQWNKDENPILGANSDSLVLSSITLSDTGYYQLYAVSACDTIFSDPARLELDGMPSIVGSNQVFEKCLLESFLLKVNSTSTSPITFQWNKNGLPILNAIADSLFIPTVAANDTGTYTVTATGLCGTVNSDPSYLQLAPNTSVSKQPSDLTKCIGDDVLLISSGLAATKIEWFSVTRGSLNVFSDTLKISSIQANDEDLYFAQISGNCNLVETDTVGLTVRSLPIGTLPDTSKICVNASTISMPGFSNYLWSTGSISSSTNVVTSGKYKVWFTDNFQCRNTDSTEVIILPLPGVYAGEDTVFCNELQLQLNGVAKDYNNVLWTYTGNGNFSNPTSVQTIFIPQIAAGELGIITLSATNNCGEQSDYLLVNLSPKILANFAPEDTLVCENSAPILLVPESTGGLFTGLYVSGNLFDPKAAGKYLVQYEIEDNGCKDLQERSIEVLKTPVAQFDFSPKPPTIDFPVVFQNNSLFSNTFLWDFDFGNTSNLDSPEFHFEKEGIYTIQLTAYNSICYDTTSQSILLLGSNFIWAPNAFTPNGDGTNERYHVIYKNSKPATISIYNRWGELMYRSNNLSEGWDGNYKGNPCKSDVYFYVVEYLDNQNATKLLKGNITLLR